MTSFGLGIRSAGSAAGNGNGIALLFFRVKNLPRLPPRRNDAQHYNLARSLVIPMHRCDKAMIESVGREQHG